MTTRDIVIVGGGLAAAKAAEAARSSGFAGTLTIVSEERHRPYERPPLSKGYLLGETQGEDVFVHEEAFYDEHDIRLRLGDEVTAIDRNRSEVVTASERRVSYDRLLLATGAAPRRLPVGPEGLDGVVSLRTLDDSRSLGAHLRAVDHVTVVGAGWIGCEVAAAARTLGASVAMIDPLDVPLQRVLGNEIGRVFADLHAARGVDLRMGVGVSGIHGTDAVDRVSLSDGSTIETDLVVVGIGVVPRTELAEKAGLYVDNGVVVDARLATSDPRILAAGDVARAWNPTLDRHVRVEHWANALNQGETAGRNLAGGTETYDRLPYFYTDQYDLGMEYSGLAEDWDEVVVRGSVADLEFLAFWLRDGRIVAGMNVNVWDVIEDIQDLIRTGGTVAGSDSPHL